MLFASGARARREKEKDSETYAVGIGDDVLQLMRAQRILLEFRQYFMVLKRAMAHHQKSVKYFAYLFEKLLIQMHSLFAFRQ